MKMGKSSIADTSFNAFYFRVIQEMVNEKKHSQVLQYSRGNSDQSFYYHESGSFLFDGDFKNDDPHIQIVFNENTNRRLVDSYYFTSNKRDVLKLCSFACHATAYVMDLFYDRIFSETERKIVTPEDIKITISDHHS